MPTRCSVFILARANVMVTDVDVSACTTSVCSSATSFCLGVSCACFSFREILHGLSMHVDSFL